MPGLALALTLTLAHRNFLPRLKYKVFAELLSIFSLFPFIWFRICTLPFISFFLHSFTGIETLLHEK